MTAEVIDLRSRLLLQDVGRDVPPPDAVFVADVEGSEPEWVALHFMLLTAAYRERCTKLFRDFAGGLRDRRLHRFHRAARKFHAELDKNFDITHGAIDDAAKEDTSAWLTTRPPPPRRPTSMTP